MSTDGAAAGPHAAERLLAGPLRCGGPAHDGLVRLAAARRGALVVLSLPGGPAAPSALPSALLSDGFPLDVPLTGPLLAELAKLDGALLLDVAAERILRANVQVNTDPSVETAETGSRHRAGERFARQTGGAAVVVSSSTGMATLFVADRRTRLDLSCCA